MRTGQEVETRKLTVQCTSHGERSEYPACSMCTACRIQSSLPGQAMHLSQPNRPYLAGPWAIVMNTTKMFLFSRLGLSSPLLSWIIPRPGPLHFLYTSAHQPSTSWNALSHVADVDVLVHYPYYPEI